jgi:hypothetical protein
MFFELSVAPQMWKKSEDIDEENLKDRLFWTEHEQWVRQCELARDPTDPTFLENDTRIIMKNVLLPTGTFIIEFVWPVTGRWKSFFLLLRARNAEDEEILSDFLGVLEIFNIKTSDKPVTVTSDLGEALGVEVETELEGLPYNVRYSFDVCLAHGYLYVS